MAVTARWLCECKVFSACACVHPNLAVPHCFYCAGVRRQDQRLMSMGRAPYHGDPPLERVGHYWRDTGDPPRI